MARRAKKETVEADEQRIAMTPEERFQKHYPAIRVAKLELDEQQDIAKKANSVYRGRLKAFKKDGGNIEMLCEALRLQKREVDEIDRDFRDLNAYLKLMDIPVGTQLGLFADGQSIASAIDADRIGKRDNDEFETRPITTERALRDAKSAGFDAGSDGKSADTNPHEEGTPESLAWAGGYRDAQTALAKTLGGSRRGRGKHSSENGMHANA